jgi:signal transduction histidine kinase
MNANPRNCGRIKKSSSQVNKKNGRNLSLDRSRSRNLSGSGLGLSICKSILNALEGEIRAANGNSGGLRIEVKLPLSN